MTTYWLWYPGDFEIRQGMMQNFTREERGMGWPAYWYLEDCYHNVFFQRKYQLTRATAFQVQASGVGHVKVDNQKYPFETPITCPPGDHQIEIYVGNPNGLPSIYVTGELIYSDPSWQVSNFLQTTQVGYDERYTQAIQDPNQLYYAKRPILPQNISAVAGGTLYDFGQAVNGSLRVTWQGEQRAEITLCYGESETETLDTKDCYYQQRGVTPATPIRKRAFRYVFIPQVQPDQVALVAEHEYYPRPRRAKWQSNDKQINQIWQVAQTTFDLCSDWFFIDGIKRDRWIWAGDAYQANFINQYSNFDEGVDRRTILALRGHDEVKQHLNTIVDYSIWWVISVYNHYQMTGDRQFLAKVYPKMKAMVDYLRQQTDEHGFLYGRDHDWIFVDWSEIDKEGITAAEQLLLVAGYRALVSCGEVLAQDVEEYQEASKQLLAATLHYFWDDELGCFIDSYRSGKRHVSRHPNILAVLFDLVTPERQQSILNKVLLNEQITQITTPYFKFFEQDALCKLGQQNQVLLQIRNYWGGMLALGATTFWEEYDPQKEGAAHYAMYGDPYGKSLCHAWGASPIYLLGRYFIGLRPLTPGYQTFEVAPVLTAFENLDCTLPLKDGELVIHKKGSQLQVQATRPGGCLRLGDQTWSLSKGEIVTVKITE